VIAAEAKLTEQGFGTCSCAQRDVGKCSPAVAARPYWRVASRELGLRRVRNEKSCPLSLAYQAVRNIAAAAAIAGPSRRAAFLLLFYDERNPYCSGSGRWPGWVALLRDRSSHSTVEIAACSW
jgi:Restriction Endonuclease associating with ARP